VKRKILVSGLEISNNKYEKEGEAYPNELVFQQQNIVHL
jgi:hypothetical protein